MKDCKQGGFTLPGEAGYEELTLDMAKTWGADVIRDSDGTELSDKIRNSGYGIYSTICVVRDHNAWAKKHPEAVQQTFLCTQPRCASEGALFIPLMSDFFSEQFRVNDGERAMAFWQVYDRTADALVPREEWSYDAAKGTVAVSRPAAFHFYTVSFLAYRIWEEISMYNHITNGWDKEHLIPIDPRTPAARDYLCEWLGSWCADHPQTSVVRFTSMFYNFPWIWGASSRNRSLFSDWGSYDFTVSEQALSDFEKEYGYALTAEDFINKGDFHVTHMPPDAHKRDYMEFTQNFVADFGSRLVKLVHSFGKKAFVFYDDSWIGVEPYGRQFARIGFDGIIKCVFSGYEVRLCAGVPVETHELRLHPYLFPTGLNGSPTFEKGGDPARDAREYWNHVRRALLRVKIDRIGLGGYLHLVREFPDFVEYIRKIAEEFREIRGLHEKGNVYTLPVTAAVLHSWGNLRPWTLSGHFHETCMHDLIHLTEALSGLPVNVKFINFEDVKNGGLEGVDVVINAGRAGTAWSGGGAWRDTDLVAALTGWVCKGGAFLGVNEPSAVPGYGEFFRMAQILGIDEDTGARVCHGRWNFEVESIPGLIPSGAGVGGKKNLYLTGGNVKVLAAPNGVPAFTVHKFGAGKGIYLSDFKIGLENTRLLLNLLLWAKGLPLDGPYLTDTACAECAWYPSSRKLVLINNSGKPQPVSVGTEAGPVRAELDAFETRFVSL